MGSFVRLPAKDLSSRIDAGYYRPEYVANAKRLLDSSLERAELSSLVSDGRRTLYFGTSTLEEEQAPEDWVPFLTSDDLGEDGFFIETRARRRVPPSYLHDYPAGRLRSGELLVKVKGPNQTTAYIETVPEYPVLVSGTIWGGLVRKDIVDPHYLVAALSCPYAATARTRLRTNLNVEFLGADDLLSLALPKPARLAQRYIGDKIRQAERLRERARATQARLDALLKVEAIEEALRATDSRTNRLSVGDLRHRLDGKFYSRRALAVYRACSADVGVKVGALNPNISNGFEYRQFVPEGRPYVTVSEVSSGRLDLAGAPRIPWEIPVPEKARLTTSCVLVVRGGSIGFAACVQSDDTSAAVSSDLIRLEFDSDQMAAAVGLFLNSSAGRCLQHKVSYGGVMPKLGQDELLDIPVPGSVLARADQLLGLFNQREAAVRNASRLTNAARLLVEQLIEGHVTEADLATAQKALEAGDRSADRAILQALRQGDAVDAKPLVPDLDGLYALLDEPDAEKD